MLLGEMLRGLTPSGIAFAAFTSASVRPAIVKHAVEHVIAALDRPVAVAERMQFGGRLGQGGQVGRLVQLQLVDRLVEVVERGRSDAMAQAGRRHGSEIDFVEVQLKDLVLGIGRLDANRDESLADLALEGALVADQEVLGDPAG